jgi:predicted RNase H-like HicB family nuclease
MVDPRRLSGTFTVDLGEGEDGYVVAACREIPGCASQGKTREEALTNIADAIDSCLEVMWEDWYEQAERSATSTFDGEPVKFTVVPPTVLRVQP